MRTTPLPLSVALAGVLLLTACGSQRAGHNSPSCAASPVGDPTDLETRGVKVTSVTGGSSGCGGALFAAEFQITNRGTEARTYTVTFTVLSTAGEALSNPEQTVRSIEPGQTVKRAVDDSASVPAAARVRILKVRSVPTAEAPAPTGPCPPSGVRVTADDGDAALGLRVVGLHLENCSTRDYRLDGYPGLQLLDEDLKPITGVRILHGSGGISTGTNLDAAPRPVTLRPGESASTGLLWRNTVTDGTPVNAPYVRIHAKPGADPVTVTPELDLGTTGKLGVGPWQKDSADG